jgi:hypothetical protein
MACSENQAGSCAPSGARDPGPSRSRRLERAIGRGIVAPRRSNSGHLHRPWRTTLRRSTPRAPASSRRPRLSFDIRIDGAGAELPLSPCRCYFDQRCLPKAAPTSCCRRSLIIKRSAPLLRSAFWLRVRKPSGLLPPACRRSRYWCASPFNRHVYVYVLQSTLTTRAIAGRGLLEVHP